MFFLFRYFFLHVQSKDFSPSCKDLVFVDKDYQKYGKSRIIKVCKSKNFKIIRIIKYVTKMSNLMKINFSLSAI